MNFNEHINEVNKKVIGTLAYISRISNYFDKSTRTMVVQSLVLSVINFCIRIWGSTSECQKIRVQKLQNFAARVAVGGLRKFDHVSPAFEELQWLRINEKHLYETLVHVFKNVNHIYPSWYSCYSYVQLVTNCNTRQENKLYVPKFKTDAGARAMKVLGAKAWNNLPKHITDATSLSSFKSQLKKHFLK